jgi:hypothetical protein
MMNYTSFYQVAENLFGVLRGAQNERRGIDVDDFPFMLSQSKHSWAFF